MSNKSKKPKQQAAQPFKKPQPFTEEQKVAAAARVKDVLAKLAQPYEPVLAQITRMGVNIRMMDVTIGDDPQKCVVIELEELVRKELDYIQHGGVLAKQQPVESPPNPLAGLAKAIQALQSKRTNYQPIQVRKDTE